MARDIENKCRGGKRKSSLIMLGSIMLVFVVMGCLVFMVSQQISREMSNSAVQNLSESLDLIKCTIESVMRNQAEFQQLLAKDLAASDDPERLILSYEKNTSMSRVSLVPFGQEEGISSTGEAFRPEELDFSAGGTVEGLPVSQSYVNYMGTWAYSMSCPVERDGVELGTLYVEYVYDFLDRSLPDGFYNKRAMLYIMDAQSKRFVLKPKGMGERSAGHLDLEDFYRANAIVDADLKESVNRCMAEGDNFLFYHDIQKKNSLNYMWVVNGGTLFLVGYVPVSAIQQEGDTVNQNISIVVIVMLVAFFLCCTVYFFNRHQHNKIRKEREAERELHNRQLAEALRAAQLASSSKTTFLSNMSHDIRTPMNAVLGFTKLLDVDADDPVKVREYTKKITASGQHLLSLINDVLDVSKIESGKMVLNLAEFTLSDLVSSVDAIIKPMAEAKGQRFDLQVTGVRHEHLIGDQTRLDQVLINLLSNAVKYTQAGGSVWLRLIGLEQRSVQYQRLRIEVEDNGYGMTPEFLETIFDAFTRAENSTTNKVQGTGLGMAITKSIVELMGGTIEVTSQLDKGSLFRVELELRVPEGQAEQAFWQSHGVSSALLFSGGEAMGEALARLEGSGLMTFTATDIDGALERIRNGGPQIAILDWEQLGGDPDKALRQVREAMPKERPVLVLSGLGEAPAMEGVTMLLKPFFVSDLQEKLAGLWDGPGQAAGEEELSLQGLYFMAVEDNEINAEILTDLLELEGAGCRVLENGKLAVEAFEGCEPGEFDAILMDVQMPVMNGYEAARTIRAMEREDARTIPIIAMTANAFAEDEKAALEAGMDDHVPKPIDIDRLKRAIVGAKQKSSRRDA